MPDYRITHQTVYRHGAPAGAAWQVLQLQPRAEPTQECLDFQLTIDPAPADLTTRAMSPRHPGRSTSRGTAGRTDRHVGRWV